VDILLACIITGLLPFGNGGTLDGAKKFAYNERRKR
jgi:hypothetical protein